MTVEEAVPAEVEGGREHLHVHPPVPSLPAGQVRQPSALTLEGDFYHVIDRKAAKIITDLRTDWIRAKPRKRDRSHLQPCELKSLIRRSST